MRKIEYVVSDEILITPSGLSLVGQVLGKSNLIKKANRMRTEKRSQPQIKNGDILLTVVGLLSLGKSDFENVNGFHKDEEFYKIALGIAYGIPSESSLRNRLDGIGTTMNQQILDGNVDMFLSCGYEPTSLANGCVPVDIDVSPFDNSGSHKAGVSRTYKNFEVSARNPKIKIFALETAVSRFSDVMWVMQQILFMSMDKRLAIFLLDESARINSDVITLTHEQIARYIGSAREVVSRMLKYFAGEGIV